MEFRNMIIVLTMWILLSSHHVLGKLELRLSRRRLCQEAVVRS